MGRLVHVVALFPDDELAIHRLYTRDAGFRAVCDDYEEALAALARWETVDAAKADDFRRLASEIEAEIAAYLRQTAGGGHSGG
ncbi:hypothetical protein [Amaricoccus solimangrovi]|uniref:Uncharacterized protein n=1 Tax=Amaricoccus solimangrovi TaxID=2589815 RepID=A0A501WE93_9RHOB|nr:hypothetical protein [Amaricoccus solimangrovi]TPE47728.1 hypothetical protein FJM51_19610 [Amaricoccus solimangrovi]